MAGPWEKYGASEATAEGPWAKYRGAPIELPEVTAKGNDAENLLAGVGRGMTRAGLAMKQAAGMAGDAIGIPGAAQMRESADASLADMEATDAELMGTKAGSFGSGVGSFAVAAPTMFVPGVNTLAGATLAGATQGGLLVPGTAAERLQEGAKGAGFGAAGFGVGKGLQAGAQAVMGRISENAAQKAAQNAMRDSVAAETRNAGYIIPPVTTNPTAWARLMEGFAGKTATAQQASIQNQSTTNRLVREAIGLPENAPITKPALQSIRARAGQDYAALDSVPITADAEYGRALSALTSRQTKASEGFPGQGPDPLAAEVAALWQPQFTGGQATAKISLLREQAKAAFARNDGSLARGLNGAADALEDVIDRNLQATGNGQLLTNYRNARQLIAKTHTIERALNESTGNIDAHALARQLAKGKPLSGGLKTAAQAGQAFPKATAVVNESMPGISPLDMAVGLIGTSAGSPAGWGLALGRPMVRNAILSTPYQSRMTVPNYGPNMLTRFAGDALQSPALPNALAMTAAYGATQ